MQNIILKGNPKSTQAIYGINCRGNFPTRYMTAKGKFIKEDYQWQVKRQWKGDPVSYSLDIEVKLYFGDNRKRDIDNFGKILWDSMTGIVYDDDSQIKKVMTEVFYDKADPRIELNIKRYGKSK